MSEPSISVLLADDHPVVRMGLAAMLESAEGITVVAEAASGEEAIARAESVRPDLVLLDLRMSGMDGVEATGEILRRSPGTAVIIVTTYDNDADILRAVEAGATGYLLKGSSRGELVEAARAAARGETVLTPRIAGKLYKAKVDERRALSARETEVLRLVSQGLTNAEIGRRLYISEATVKTHMLRIFKKLDVSDRTAAVMAAMKLRL